MWTKEWPTADEESRGREELALISARYDDAVEHLREIEG